MTREAVDPTSNTLMSRKRHGWSHDSAVLDVFVTNVFPELCKVGFLQPSGLRTLPVCLRKVGVLHDSKTAHAAPIDVAKEEFSRRIR